MQVYGARWFHINDFIATNHSSYINWPHSFMYLTTFLALSDPSTTGCVKLTPVVKEICVRLRWRQEGVVAWFDGDFERTYISVFSFDTELFDHVTIRIDHGWEGVMATAPEWFVELRPRDVPATDNKLLGCCCRNPLATMINPLSKQGHYWLR